MCGRFNLRLSPAELQEFFDLFRVPQVSPRFNIAPSQEILSVVAEDGGRKCAVGPWGIRPAWKPSQFLINARAETVFTTRAFSMSAKQRRCLVPVSGFYEWQMVGTGKQPWHITLASGEPMAFAAFHDSDGAIATMTTQSNAEMARIHNRMPVILPRETWDHYLDPNIDSPEAIAPLLLPLPAGSLTMYATDPVVNNARHETPDCIRPVTLVVLPGQQSLFAEDGSQV